MQQRLSFLDGFRRYPVEVVGHVVQGAGAALGVLHGGAEGMMLAGLWTAGYIAYQGYTRIRKQDAAGLDVLDYMVGMGIGIAASGLLRAVSA